MKIPNYINHKFVDKDGYLTEPWKQVLNQLINELQSQMSDEGHIAPSQNTADITTLNDTKYTGGFLYNTDTNKAMVNINGVYKDIQTS